MDIKQIIKRTPILGTAAIKISRKLVDSQPPFENSTQYWRNRYQNGGNSGDGSYNQLAEFKAELLNRFVADNEVLSVIEYGCGDGNQLSLSSYPKYTGFDISPEAISICRSNFSGDKTKTFRLLDTYQSERAELTLSLDVIFHLVEDEIFSNYMNRLFDSSEKFVIIYSSNTEDNKNNKAPHVKHRNFTRWIEKNMPSWKLIQHIPNKYPFNGDNKNSSFADFYIYSKA